MNPSSRRLTFVVGTSLLTASLATGCKKSEPTVNPGPEPVHVNEGPAPEETVPEETPDAATDAPAEEDPNAEAVAPE